MAVDSNAFRCSESRYALLFVPTEPTIFYEPVAESRWSTEDITLLVSPEDGRDLQFLSRLQRRDKIIVAYMYDVAFSQVVDRIVSTKAGRSQIELKFQIEQADFSPSMEMGFASTSADKLAELRARRLLLNESPTSESTDINAVTRELFIGGMDTQLRVERSPFPAAFQAFGDNPRRFLEISWVLAIMQLKLSACVVDVESLILTLEDTDLIVDFAGRRKKKYQNAPAYELRIKGVCNLSP
jgi:hypothetical protein